MSGTRFDPVAHAEAMRAQGFWLDKNYDEFLRQAISEGTVRSWRRRSRRV